MNEKVTLDLQGYEELKKKARSICLVNISSLTRSEYGLNHTAWQVGCRPVKGINKKDKIIEEVKKIMNTHNNDIADLGKAMAKIKDLKKEIRNLKNRSLWQRIRNIMPDGE